MPNSGGDCPAPSHTIVTPWEPPVQDAQGFELRKQEETWHVNEVWIFHTKEILLTEHKIYFTRCRQTSAIKMKGSGLRGVGLASNTHSEGVSGFPLLPQKRELELKKAQELPYLTWLISGKKRQEPDEMVRDETTSQHLSGSRTVIMWLLGVSTCSSLEAIRFLFGGLCRAASIAKSA